MSKIHFNFRHILRKFAILYFFITLSFIFTGNSYAAYGINREINFQGKLVNNPAATNVSDSSYTMVFTFYDAATGGTALWTETQTVTTTDGIFRVALGSVTPFPANFNFNWSGLYLGIKVNSDSEMTPRIQMAAVPFAFNSQQVAGLTVEDNTGLASTSGTLQIPNAKTVKFNDAFTTTNAMTFGAGTTGTITLGSNADNLSLVTNGSTTATLPSGTITLVDLASSQTLTNKTIGAGGLTFNVSSGPDITTTSNQNFVVTPNGTGSTVITSNATSGLLVGSSSNVVAPLSVNGGIGSNAALIVNQLNSGDIFTASASGTTKFTIGNNGNLTATGTLTGLTGLSSSGTITFSSFNASNNVLYATSGTGQVAGANTSLANLCLVSGVSAPTWTTCTGIPTTDLYWNQQNGTLFPNDSTVDLLIGGQSSASAKFAVLNDNNGTPIASVSSGLNGTSAYLTADGTLATQNRMNLTIGNSSTYNTTGNVLINPNGTGNVGIGTISPTALLDVAGAASVGGQLTFRSGTAQIQSTANQLLTIGGNTTGDIQFKPGNSSSSLYLSSTGNVGIGTAGPSAKFQVAGNNGSTPTNSLAVFGTDIAASTGTNRAKVTIGNSTGNSEFLVGQGASNNLLFNWTYNATPANAYGILETYGGSNPIYIQDVANTTANVGLGVPGGTSLNSKLVIKANGNTSSDSALNVTNSSNTSLLFVRDDGNVGIGTTSPNSILQINSSGVPVSTVANLTTGAVISNGFGGSAINWGTDDTGSSSTSYAWIQGAYANNGSIQTILALNPNGGNVGIGINSPAAPLQVNGAYGSNAALIVNQLNSGDLFVASSSGTTKFKIDNSGNLYLASGTTIDTLAAGTLGIGTTTATTITLGRSGQGITLPGFTGQNGVLYGTYTTGVLGQATTATSSQCLLSGSSNPAWGTCPSGGGGVNWWNELAGALSPVNINDDLLLGSTSTSSALFSYTGIKTGNTIASVSGNLIVMPNNGWGGEVGIGVTSPNNLIQVANLINFPNSTQGTFLGYQAGNSNTGNNNSFIGYQAGYSNTSSNNTAVGNSALYSNTTNGANTAVGYDALYSSTGLANTAVGQAAGYTSVSGNANTTGSKNTFVGHDSGPGTSTQLDNSTAIGNAATVNCSNCLVLGGINGINGATASTNVGIGIQSPLAVLDAEGGYGSNAALIVNQLNSGDLFVASASGATKFRITNAGSIDLPGTNPTISADGTNTLTLNNNSTGSIQFFSSSNTLSNAGVLTIASNAIVGGNLQVNGGTISSNNMAISIDSGTANSISLGASDALNISGNFAQTGITTFSTGTGLVSINGNLNTSLIPNSTALNLGSSSNYWGTLYADNIISPLTGVAGYWQRNLGAIAPSNITDDLLLGSTSTTSAKFAVLGVATTTVTASISGNLSLNVPTGANPKSTLNLLNGGTLTVQGSNGGDSVVSPRLYIGSNGFVGIGVTNPLSNLSNVLQVVDQYGTVIDGGTTAEIEARGTSAHINVKSTGNTNDALINFFRSTNTLDWQIGLTNSNDTIFRFKNPSGKELLTLNNTSVGVNANINNTNALLSTLDVRLGLGNGTISIASFSGQTSFAGLVVDNSGFGDLFTASSAGKTLFTVQNNGNIAATGTLTGLTGLTLSSGAITLGGSTGTSSNCLLGGATASWGSCSGTSSGVNWWNELAGALSPVNINDDLLLGSTSTSSALFSYTGIKTGNTIASVSGNLIVMPNNGWGGFAGIGITNPLANLYVRDPATGAIPNAVYEANAVAIFERADARMELVSNDVGPVGSAIILNNVAGTSNNKWYMITGTSSNNNEFFLGYTPNATNNIFTGYNTNTKLAITTGGLVGIGTTTPVAPLHISAGYGSNAALIVNQLNSGDLLVASASGTTKFRITNAGSIDLSGTNPTISADALNTLTLNAATVTLGSSVGSGITLPGFTGQNGVLYGTYTTGVLGQATTATSSQCLLSGSSNPAWGTCPSGGGGVNWWNQLGGVLSPVNTNYDLAIGGTSTSSALFSYTGIETGNTIASVSGNLIVMPNNGWGGEVGINTTTPQYSLDINGNARIQQTNVLNFNTNGYIGYNSTEGSIRLAANTGTGLLLNTGNSGGNGKAISFDIGNIEYARLDPTGNFGIGTTTPVAPLHISAGYGSNAALIVNQLNSGDLIAASSSGTTEFVVGNTGKVTIGNSTNGLTFDPAAGPTYSGTAQPLKTITLSPEYAGATLTASGSATTTGSMTADASPSANFRTYYQWSSTQSTLEDYYVVVRVTLPNDFSSWATSNAMTIDLDTATTNAAQNKLDILIYNPSTSTSTPVMMSTGNTSSTGYTWATLTFPSSRFTGTPAWNTAGQTALIYLHMFAGSPAVTQVGDIVLNYNAKF